MCWAQIVEVCLGGVIVIEKKGGDKNDLKRVNPKMREGKPDDGHNQDCAV